MADLRFRIQRGGPGWRLDWDSSQTIIKAAGAAKVAIDACMEIAVAHARSDHPEYPPVGVGRFANRTRQTIDAIKVLEPARIEWVGDKPWVHGDWGIENGPAFQDPDIWSGRWPGMRPHFRRPVEGEEQSVSILDRAMFLEFGTIQMAPRPFIYPAWDSAKVLMPELLAIAYRGFAGGRGHTRGTFHP